MKILITLILFVAVTFSFPDRKAISKRNVNCESENCRSCHSQCSLECTTRTCFNDCRDTCSNRQCGGSECSTSQCNNCKSNCNEKCCQNTHKGCQNENCHECSPPPEASKKENNTIYIRNNNDNYRALNTSVVITLENRINTLNEIKNPINVNSTNINNIVLSSPGPKLNPNAELKDKNCCHVIHTTNCNKSDCETEQKYTCSNICQSPVVLLEKVQVPYPVKQFVPVDRPYPIRIPQYIRIPQPVIKQIPVPQPFPVLVSKPIPVMQPVPVHVPVPKPIIVEKPIPIPVIKHVAKPVGIPQPFPVDRPVPFPTYMAPPRQQILFDCTQRQRCQHTPCLQRCNQGFDNYQVHNCVPCYQCNVGFNPHFCKLQTTCPPICRQNMMFSLQPHHLR